jgi:hypothetical protein
MGSLQMAFPHPVDADVEQGLLEILKRKVASSLSMYVDTVRAFQQAYGPQALDILRARRLQAAFGPRIRFTRTQTLMQGHEYCNHVYNIEQA